MKILKDKKTVIFVLIVICLLQLMLSLFWADKKSYLFMDEVFSYATSNRAEGTAAELPAYEWLDERWLLDYVTVDEEHTFEYSIPYKNQASDVHPPLYYLFLHTACSLIPEKFSYWAGTGCNIAFFIVSTIVLYFVGKELFKDKICGLLAAFLFSISYGGLNTMAFIRMYMLLTLIVLMHTYVYIKYMEQEKVPRKGYLLLALTLIAGVMTQYYFLMIAFFYGVWYTVSFFFEKKYQKLIKYISTILASAVCSLMLYPTMWKHIFHTSRGAEARENFFSLGEYPKKLRTMLKLMDSQLFFNLFLLIFIILIILAMVYFQRKGQIQKEICKRAGAILFACAGYLMIVTKIAPYQIDRYLMPIYPLVYLLIIGAVYKLARKLIPTKAVVALCVCGFGGLSLIHMVYSAIPHTYSEDIIISPRLAVAEENHDSYAIYIGSRDEIPKYYDILQVLSRYRGYYYIDGSENTEQVREDMRFLEEGEQIILYVDKTMGTEEVFSYIEEIFPDVVLNENCLLHKDEKWDVYSFRKEEMQIYLPEIYYAATGQTMEIYNQQVTSMCADITKYNVLWSCDIGENLERKYSLTATKEMIGDHELTLSIYDNALKLLEEKTCILRVSDGSAEEVPKLYEIKKSEDFSVEEIPEDIIQIFFEADDVQKGQENAREIVKLIDEIRAAGIEKPVYVINAIYQEKPDKEAFEQMWDLSQKLEAYENVYFLPVNISVDSKYNYKNGLPGEAAYAQMEDMIFALYCGTINQIK